MNKNMRKKFLGITLSISAFLLATVAFIPSPSYAVSTGYDAVTNGGDCDLMPKRGTTNNRVCEDAAVTGLVCEHLTTDADNEGTCVRPGSGEARYGVGTGATFTDTGLNQGSDVKGTVAQIVNIILGFLGIIAVIIILAGGFKWMTAGGNEDKVGEARSMIIQGVIGLVIVFAAWIIASFVINQLQSATA